MTGPPDPPRVPLAYGVATTSAWRSPRTAGSWSPCPGERGLRRPRRRSVATARRGSPAALGVVVAGHARRARPGGRPSRHVLGRRGGPPAAVRRVARRPGHGVGGGARPRPRHHPAPPPARPVLAGPRPRGARGSARCRWPPAAGVAGRRVVGDTHAPSAMGGAGDRRRRPPARPGRRPARTGGRDCPVGVDGRAALRGAVRRRPARRPRRGRADHRLRGRAPAADAGGGRRPAGRPRRRCAAPRPAGRERRPAAARPRPVAAATRRGRRA